jgi:hypothetical protein
MEFTMMHILLFVAAFAVGCVMVYMSPVEHKTVFVYPTPSNVKKLQYKDSAGGCFGFTSKEVKCTSDAKSIPAQV